MVGAQFVAAQEIVKYGIRFPVDEIQPIDEKSVQIALFGDSRIIAVDEVESFVLEQYFSAGTVGHLEKSQVISFVQASVQEKDIASAAQGLSALVQHPQVTQLEVVEFVSAMPETEIIFQLFQAMLRTVDVLREMPDVLGAMVYQVALKDIDWLKTEGVRTVYLYSGAVKGYFKAQFYRDLANVNLNKIAAAQEAFAGLFGTEDTEYRSLNSVFIKLRQGITALERLDPEGMLSMLDLAQTNETLRQILPPVIVQTVHRTAQAALTNGNAGKALTLLSWIDFDWRTPTTHALVVEALSKLEVEQASNIIGTRIEKFLAFLSGKDPLVRDAYADFLEQDLRSKVARGHFGQVQTHFDRLRLIRPDPNRKNDELRVDCAVRLFDSGYRGAAAELYHSIQTRISLSAWFQLFRRGLVVDLVVFACGVLIPILLILWLILRRIPAARNNEDEEIDALIDEEFLHAEEIDDEQPVFATFVGRSRDPVFLSYEKQLRKFKLKPDANLREIKQAYRQAIKEVHPDINPNIDEKGREHFLDLTNAYERILKLRIRLGYRTDQN